MLVSQLPGNWRVPLWPRGVWGSGRDKALRQTGDKCHQPACQLNGSTDWPRKGARKSRVGEEQGKGGFKPLSQ